jgi:hypothetical protein
MYFSRFEPLLTKRDVLLLSPVVTFTKSLDFGEDGIPGSGFTLLRSEKRKASESIGGAIFNERIQLSGLRLSMAYKGYSTDEARCHSHNRGHSKLSVP